MMHIRRGEGEISGAVNCGRENKSIVVIYMLTQQVNTPRCTGYMCRFMSEFFFEYSCELIRIGNVLV